MPTSDAITPTNLLAFRKWLEMRRAQEISDMMDVTARNPTRGAAHFAAANAFMEAGDKFDAIKAGKRPQR